MYIVDQITHRSSIRIKLDNCGIGKVLLLFNSTIHLKTTQNLTIFSLKGLRLFLKASKVPEILKIQF